MMISTLELGDLFKLEVQSRKQILPIKVKPYNSSSDTIQQYISRITSGISYDDMKSTIPEMADQFFEVLKNPKNEYILSSFYFIERNRVNQYFDNGALYLTESGENTKGFWFSVEFYIVEFPKQ